MKPIIPIWTIQKSHILEDTSILSLNYSALKAGHWWIFGKSGSGKTFSLISLLFSTIKQSIQEQEAEYIKKKPEDRNHWDTFVLLDPHNSFIEPTLTLLGKYLSANYQLSRYSNIFRYSKDTIENNKEFKEGFYMNKTLFFNPLFSLSLLEDVSEIDKLVGFNISSLKGIFEHNAFWPQNTPILELFIKTWLLLNLERYKRDKGSILLSFRDIYEILDDMGKNKKNSLISFNKEIAMLFTSTDISIQAMANTISKDLETLNSNIKNNNQFHITAITKIKDFHSDLWNTFWYKKSYSELTLDISFLMNGIKTETEVNFFDFSKFNSQQKKVLISFFTNAIYHLWAKKNHLNTKLWKHYYACDEFQSFLELKGTKNPLLDISEKILNEHRKKKISMLFVFQSISRELQDLMNNLSYSFVFSLPPEQAEIFIPVLNSWLMLKLALESKDIVNLKIWEYYANFDTANFGTLSILAHSLNIANSNTETLLFNNWE